MNDPTKLKPNEYIEDGIVYVRDESTGWAFFDDGGAFGDEDDDDNGATSFDEVPTPE